MVCTGSWGIIFAEHIILRLVWVQSYQMHQIVESRGLNRYSVHIGLTDGLDYNAQSYNK